MPGDLPALWTSVAQALAREASAESRPLWQRGSSNHRVMSASIEQRRAVTARSRATESAARDPLLVACCESGYNRNARRMIVAISVWSITPTTLAACGPCAATRIWDPV